MSKFTLSYNGERKDPLSGVIHLGMGHRAYSQNLMRFSSPDSSSPFSLGGGNCYAYCAGDPVNMADPGGRHSILAWAGLGIAFAAGVLLTPVTGGSSLGIALSVISVTSALLSIGLGVAQQFIEASDPITAAALGWAALGTGALSLISSITLTRMIPKAWTLSALLKGSTYRQLEDIALNDLSMTGVAGSNTSDATNNEIEILGYIHGNRVGDEIGTIAQNWGTGDLRSVMNTRAALPAINLKTMSADELYLHGHLSSDNMSHLDTAQQLIFNTDKLQGKIKLIDYVNRSNAWYGRSHTISANKLKHGGIDFILSRDAAYIHPGSFSAGEAINIRSKLSDVFRLKGRVHQNTASILRSQVFIEMPPTVGLPWEFL